VSDPNSGTQYALKKVVLHNKDTLNIIKNECQIWKELTSHNNIVTFVDAKQQGDSIHILSELCTGGTLLDLLEKYNGKMTEAQIVHITIDICQGLKYMHEKGIQHRDIKVENILLQEKSFKLCDFGSASKSVLDPS
jgi:serine/threonine protein kinase